MGAHWYDKNTLVWCEGHTGMVWWVHTGETGTHRCDDYTLMRCEGHTGVV